MSAAYRLPSAAVLVEHLRTQRELYAPLAQEGEYHWLRLADDAPAPAITPEQRPLYSPKQFFFAEEEALYAFEGGRFVPRLPDVAPRALLGVHACDLTAIAYMDRFFADDRHYRARRAATLLVGIDCQHPCQHGFCHAMDAGPAVRDGHADLVLSRDEDATVLIASSEAGEAAIAGLPLSPADPTWSERRAAAELEVRARFDDCSHITDGMAKLDRGEVDADTWERLGVQCLACSGCTSVCPTCSCFAPRVHNRPDAAEHARVWDSCLFDGFQREASGAHPAASPGMRVERYWFHKLGAPFRQEHGRATCVGCGRCEAVCPGSIGVHSVLKRLTAS